MEGTIAAMEGILASNHCIDNDDVISFDSDSSGDTNLRRTLERNFLTPDRQLPSDHREGVPADSPQRRNSKERIRPRPPSYQADRSPIPYSWYYNPYSQRDYSPSLSSVTPRKSISSWMDAMLRTPQQDFQDDNNDDSSIDSVEQLERVALQIRSEIRQLEMKELADEAEEAAEAGRERFAGRASTFGDSTHSLNYVELENTKPLKLKRYTTYSEGTSLLKQVRPVRPKPKIRCLQLRDISEVIPSIGELHSHLKTHLVMAGVEQESLSPAPDEKETEPGDKEKDKKRSDGVKTPVQFLNSLKSWVSTSPSKSSAPQSPATDIASDITTPRQTTVQRCNKRVLDSLHVNADDEEDGEGSITSFGSTDPYEVGGRLSAHLHAPKAVHRSPIRVPTGLDLPEDLGFPQHYPTKLLMNEGDVDTVETVPTSTSSQQGDLNQDQGVEHGLEGLTPIALFPEDDNDTDGDQQEHTNDGAIAASPHATEVGPPNEFVTPMRLRVIRKASKRHTLDSSSPACQATDLEWRLNAVNLRQVNSDPHALVDENHSLNIPLLTTKSDGDCSPAKRLNRSKDISIASLPQDIFTHHRPASRSLSGPPLNDSLVPDLERPKSLSFDEHDIVVESKSSNEFTNEHLLIEDILLNDVSGDSMLSKPSRDLSFVVAPSDEIDIHTVPTLETKVNRMGLEMSSQPLDESLPLMPTLEKIDEPRFADESNVVDNSIITEDGISTPKTLAIAPRIEQRKNSVESGSSMPEIQTDNDSVQSLELEEIFDTDETERRDDSHRRPSLAEVAESVRIEASKLRFINAAAKGDSDEPVQSEEHSRDDTAETESGPPSFLSHSVSLFDTSGMMVDEEPFAATDEESISYVGSVMDCPDDEVEMEASPGAVDRSTHDALLPVCGTPEQVSIEVKKINDSLDIGGHYEELSESHSSSSKVEKREEIVRSPSGRVRVTIEQSSHHDGVVESNTSEDDDVRSEADSSRTPQPHTCECWINVASQLEDSVGVDLANATRARYDSLLSKRYDKNTSIVSDPGQFPISTNPPKEVSRDASAATSGYQHNRSPIRRALSCPSFVALAAEAEERVTDAGPTIPHKGISHQEWNGLDSYSDRALAGRREHFRSSSMLDPCQSTSPFKDTMDDMMKSFSPKTSIEVERNLRLQAQANREFLHNYLYCGKSSEEPEVDKNMEVSMCGDHCDYLSGVLDAYRSFVPHRSSSKKDMLSLNTSDRENSTAAAPESWFDVASEHFDGALESIMGRAHAQHRRWNSMFQAPGLKSKKDSNPRKKDVQGIVLVKQSSKLESHGGELSDEQFEVMYGLTREEFAKLPVTERSVLHDAVNRRRKHWNARINAEVGIEPPSPALSARSMSSCDLANHMRN